MKTKMLVTAAVVMTVVLAGCSSTPRGLQHEVSKPDLTRLDTPQSEATAAFALRMSEAVRNIELADPFMPDVRITVDYEYRNALGEDCRRLWLLTAEGTKKSAGVCKTSTGLWRFVPPLS